MTATTGCLILAVVCVGLLLLVWRLLDNWRAAGKLLNTYRSQTVIANSWLQRIGDQCGWADGFDVSGIGKLAVTQLIHMKAGNLDLLNQLDTTAKHNGDLQTKIAELEQIASDYKAAAEAEAAIVDELNEELAKYRKPDKSPQEAIDDCVLQLRNRGFGLVADGTVYGNGVWIDQLRVTTIGNRCEEPPEVLAAEHDRIGHVTITNSAGERVTTPFQVTCKPRVFCDMQDRVSRSMKPPRVRDEETND